MNFVIKLGNKKRAFGNADRVCIQVKKDRQWITLLTLSIAQVRQIMSELEDHEQERTQEGI